MNWQLYLYKFISKIYLKEVKEDEFNFKLDNNDISIEYTEKVTRKIFFTEDITRSIKIYINGKEINIIIIDKTSTFKKFEVIEETFDEISNKIYSYISKTPKDHFEEKKIIKENKKIYLVCSLDNGNYLSLKNNLIKKKLSNMQRNEINSLAYSVFAYWEGDPSNAPESIKEIVNKSNTNNNLKDGYFLIYFDKNKLAKKKELEKIYQSSVYDREEALKYMSEFLKDSYEVSDTFSKLPDGLKMI